MGPWNSYYDLKKNKILWFIKHDMILLINSGLMKQDIVLLVEIFYS